MNDKDTQEVKELLIASKEELKLEISNDFNKTINSIDSDIELIKNNIKRVDVSFWTLYEKINTMAKPLGFVINLEREELEQ